MSFEQFVDGKGHSYEDNIAAVLQSGIVCVNAPIA